MGLSALKSFHLLFVDCPVPKLGAKVSILSESLPGNYRLRLPTTVDSPLPYVEFQRSHWLLRRRSRFFTRQTFMFPGTECHIISE